jgi:LacI family transcriptional regulator
MAIPTRKPQQIAITVPTDGEYSRGIIQGAVRFAATTRWMLSLAEMESDGTLINRSSRIPVAEPVGIIAAVENAAEASSLAKLKISCVSVSGAPHSLPFPIVTSDDRIIGSLAAGHFLERRLRQFAYLGIEGQADSERRLIGFGERLTAEGLAKPVVRLVPAGYGAKEAEGLGQWLSELPKPMGVFAFNDDLARCVVDACYAAGIKVPSGIAVLGCGNDSVVCGVASPPISSVALPAERVGFEAANILLSLLSRKKVEKNRFELDVSSVIPRGSTDTVSIADPDVAAAMRFILAHAGEWIGVRELLLAVPVQRRSLERKFRRVLGRSPLEEIRRVRVDLARQILSSTDLPMPIVARRSGFSEAKQLSMVFRSIVGMTPTDYRARFRLASDQPENATVGGNGDEGSGPSESEDDSISADEE